MSVFRSKINWICGLINSWNKCPNISNQFQMRTLGMIPLEDFWSLFMWILCCATTWPSLHKKFNIEAPRFKWPFFCKISGSQVYVSFYSSNRKVALESRMKFRTYCFDVLFNDGGKITVALYYFLKLMIMMVHQYHDSFSLKYCFYTLEWMDLLYHILNRHKPSSCNNMPWNQLDTILFYGKFCKTQLSLVLW